MSKRKTVFFTSVVPMNREHRDPNKIDLEIPRFSLEKQKVESAPRYVVLVQHQIWSEDRIFVLSNTIERSYLQRYTPSSLYLESNCDEI